MADSRVTLEVFLKSKGIEATTKELDELRAGMKKTAQSSKNLSKEQNVLKRNFDGTAQRTGRAAKDFSRMSQGMGGLVQAYATVAANVFALSSAFLVLRRAADLSSMIKSAEDFSNRFGVSVTRITKQLQRATGGAIDFADALPIVNKAISAGIGIEQIEQLSIAATKAAQTFGGTTTEAMNRFISAAQRGRVEIVQTLGIVIKTEQEYEKFAATLGKTGKELSAIERQLAITNAIIQQSQSVFDKVTIDPNPFQQLLVTVADLKNEIATFITDFLTPLINGFNKSKAAALALIAAIVSAVGGKIFPAIADNVKGLAKAGLAAGKAAREASAAASRSLVKAQIEALDKVKAAVRSNAKEIDNIYFDSLKGRIKAHGAFANAIIAQNGEIDRAALTSRRAAVGRELAARARGSGMQTAFSGLTTAQVKALQLEYDKLAASIDKGNISLQKATVANREMAATATIGLKRINQGWKNLGVTIAAANSQLRSGFAQTFGLAQQSIIGAIAATIKKYGAFVNSVVSGNKTVASSFLLLNKAIGRTGGTLAGLAARSISFLTSITFYLGIAAFLWEQYGDKIRGISEEQRNVSNAIDNFKDGLEESNEQLAEAVLLWGDKAPESLKDFVDSLTFMSGVFQTINNEIIQLQKTVITNLNGLTTEQAIQEIERLERSIEESQNRLGQAQDTFVRFGGAAAAIASRFIPAFKEAESSVSEMEATLKSLKGVLDELAENRGVGLLVRQFAQASEFAETFGVNLNRSIGEGLPILGELDKAFGQLGQDLRIAAINQDWETFLNIIRDIKENGSFATNDLVDLDQTVKKFFSTITGSASEVQRATAGALKSLQETGSNFNTFILGLDKARSQQSPFKDLLAPLLDANRAFNDLAKNSNLNLSEAFETGKLSEELITIVNLIGGVELSFEEAAEKSDILIKRFQRQIETQIVGTLQLKTEQEKLNTIKAREIRTNQQRIDQLVEGNEQELVILGRRQDLLEANIQAFDAALVILSTIEDLNPSILRQYEAQRDALIAQRDTLEEQEGILRRGTNVIVERINQQREILTTTRSLLQVEQQILNSQIKLAGSTSEFLRLSRQEIKNKEQLLDVEEQLLVNSIQRKLAEKDVTPELLQQLGVEQRRLDLIKQQKLELQRSQESLAARELEQTGTTVFSQEGIDQTALFLRRAIEAEIPNLKSSFEILGQGFAQNITDVFDTAVDNLLEGGKDFGQVVVETLKAGLRETIGEALKTRIQEAISGLILGDAGKEAQEAALREQMRQALENNAQNLEDNTKALTANTAKECCAAPTVTETGTLKTANVLEGIEQLNQEGNNTIQSVADLVATGNDISNIGNENSLQGFSSLLNVLSTLISVVSASGSGGSGGFLGAVASAFGYGGVTTAAMGGVFPELTRREMGGLTNGPEMALIGEGKNREAVVPLPNNREIPVDLKGAAGDTINIEQNFDFTNANPDTISTLRNEARLIEERTFQRVFSEINKGGQYAKITGRRG